MKPTEETMKTYYLMIDMKPLWSLMRMNSKTLLVEHEVDSLCNISH